MADRNHWLQQQEPYFGRRISGVRALTAADDLNGDGTADILVSYPGAGGCLSIHAMSGRTGLDLFIPVDGPEANFGQNLAVLGDLNGDGVDAFACTAYENAPKRATTSNRVYVMSGVDGRLLREMKPEAGAVSFGCVILAVDDLDDDGVREIVVGASRGSWEGEGELSVYSGRTGQLIRVIRDDFVLNGFGGSAALLDRWGEQRGSRLIIADDVGYGGGVERLTISIVDTRTGAVTDRWRVASAEWTPSGVNGIGDVDGDGIDDVALQFRLGMKDGATAIVGSRRWR